MPTPRAFTHSVIELELEPQHPAGEVLIGQHVRPADRVEVDAVHQAVLGRQLHLPADLPFEAEIPLPDDFRPARPNLPERDGMRLWSVTIPANGTVTLRYRVQDLTPED